eukprot:gene3849-13912_t
MDIRAARAQLCPRYMSVYRLHRRSILPGVLPPTLQSTGSLRSTLPGAIPCTLPARASIKSFPPGALPCTLPARASIRPIPTVALLRPLPARVHIRGSPPGALPPSSPDRGSIRDIPPGGLHPRQITGRLMSCTSLSQLSLEAAAHADQLNSIHASGLLVQARRMVQQGKLGGPAQQVSANLDFIADLALARSIVTKSVNSMGVGYANKPKSFDESPRLSTCAVYIASECLNRLPKFHPKEVTMILWALSKLCIWNLPLLDGLVKLAQGPMLKRFTSQGLSISLLSLASLQYLGEGLMRKAEREVVQHQQRLELNPQHVANIALSSAQLCHHLQLTTSTTLHIPSYCSTSTGVVQRQQRGELNPQDVANIALSYAQLCCGSSAFWEELGKPLFSRFYSTEQLSGPFMDTAGLMQSACNLAWAHAVMGHSAEPWLIRLLVAMEPLLANGNGGGRAGAGRKNRSQVFQYLMMLEEDSELPLELHSLWALGLPSRAETKLCSGLQEDVFQYLMMLEEDGKLPLELHSLWALCLPSWEETKFSNRSSLLQEDVLRVCQALVGWQARGEYSTDDGLCSMDIALWPIFARELDGLEVGAKIALEVDGEEVGVGAQISQEVDGEVVGVGAQITLEVDGEEVGVGAQISQEVDGEVVSVGAQISQEVDGEDVGVGAQISQEVDGEVVGEGAKIALEVDGPTHLIRNKSTSYMGPTQMHVRSLRQRGWTVVSVTYREWDALFGQEDAKAALLIGKLKSACNS